jgi:uncharacterized protein YqjF (DUF2071 family)
LEVFSLLGIPTAKSKKITSMLDKKCSVKSDHQVHSKVVQTFLTAEWRDILVLNWGIPPTQIASLVPSGVELDTWCDKAWLSLVGFRFLNTSIKGISIPLHQDFIEINLRFYVRRVLESGNRHGVVFVTEIVSRRCVAAVARLAYNEKYVVRHVECDRQSADGIHSLYYSWKNKRGKCNMRGFVTKPYGQIAADSHDAFILERISKRAIAS